jgi:GNAT superfamily N-acetyltransferase
MSRGPEIRVREGTARDREAVLALMRRSLGEGNIPRTPEFFEWKHERNPFGASPLLLAEHDGRLVGMRIFMRWAWSTTASNTVRAVRAVDTATDPEYQGKGIFKKLTLGLVDRMREEGVAFVFNTPNHKSMPGYLKMGWSDVGKVSLWIRPQRPLALVAAALAARRGAPPPAEDQQPRNEADGLDEGLDALRRSGLLARLPRPSGYHTARTLEYLRWRYAEIPGFRYGMRWAGKGEARAAVIFRRRARRTLDETTVCEVLVDGSPGGVAAGRSALSDVLGSQGSDYAVASARTRSTAAAALALAGFVPAPRVGPHFTARPLVVPDGLPDPTRAASWACSIGDLELF